MAQFSFSKVDHYRNTLYFVEEIIDIKFPSELEIPENKEILVFIVDDDPVLLQVLNTHFSKLQINSHGKPLKFNILNFATGRSLFANMNLKPDIILLNKLINKGLPNALSGNEILEQMHEIYPGQEVIILNNLRIDMHHAFIENGLRDYLMQDEKALNALNDQILEILNMEYDMGQKSDIV